MTLLEFQDILREVGIPVAHFEIRETEYSYIIFQEYSTSYTFASGNAWREITRISVDHFSKTIGDSTLEKLKLVLLKNKINFTTVTMYYPEGKIIHTQFDLSIARDIRDEGVKYD